MKDVLKTLVMAEHFCEENNCSLCMSAIQTAQSQIVLAQQTDNSAMLEIALLLKDVIYYAAEHSVVLDMCCVKNRINAVVAQLQQ